MDIRGQVGAGLPGASLDMGMWVLALNWGAQRSPEEPEEPTAPPKPPRVLPACPLRPLIPRAGVVGPDWCIWAYFSFMIPRVGLGAGSFLPRGWDKPGLLPMESGGMWWWGRRSYRTRWLSQGLPKSAPEGTTDTHVPFEPHSMGTRWSKAPKKANFPIK